MATLTQNIPTGVIALVHWSGTPAGVCSRKDSGADMVIVPPTLVPGACGATVKWTAVAHHPENISCPVCRDYERENWFKRP